MQITLGIKSPKKYPKQHQFLNLIRNAKDNEKIVAHFVGGRGCAKTTTMVLMAFELAMVHLPGLPGLITEPTHKLLHDVFLREWRKIVPAELWSFNQGLMRITLVNGTEIDLRSRNADDKNKEVSKGPNYAWAGEDEEAYKCDLKKWNDVDAAIRHPEAKFLVHFSGSTPKMNDYFKLCHRDNTTLIEATSFDNPFLPKDFAANMVANLSEEYASQEVYGRWVSLTGRIWKHWHDTYNFSDDTFDHSRPWELWCDLGINSAWIAVQKNDKGQIVAHHEWTPSDEGAEQTLTRIDALLGRVPKRVVVGHDVNTRSVADASKPSVVFRRLWGQSCEIRPVTGFIADKQLQHMQASAAICTVNGDRQFLVSKHFVSHDSDKGRGLVEMFEQDSWSDTPRTGEFLPKDHRLEHMRDAFLYGIIVNNPPRFNKTQRRAR